MAGRRSGADSDPCAHPKTPPRTSGLATRPANHEQIQQLDLSSVAEPSDLSAALKQLLASPNIASKEWIYRQYDHFVRTNTVIAPGADAAVIRINGTKKGISA